MRCLVAIILVVLGLTACRTENAPARADSSPLTLANTPTSGRKPIIAPPIPKSDAPPTVPYIYITREVKHRGLYQWSNGMTLTDAITSAGGFTEFAGRSKITIFRKDHSVAGHYNYDRIVKHEETDPVLEPGDYISVIGSID